MCAIRDQFKKVQEEMAKLEELILHKDDREILENMKSLDGHGILLDIFEGQALKTDLSQTQEILDHVHFPSKDNCEYCFTGEFK